MASLGPDVTPPEGAVVVGLDGSLVARAAEEWAAAEATRRRVPLHLLCAREVFVGSIGPLDLPLGLAPVTDDNSRRVLEEAVRRLHELHPRLAVTTHAPFGRPARHLIEASQVAGLLVVGNRGRGRLSAALLGTTTLQTVSHSHCPVVVVSGPVVPSGPSRRVVVGADGSEASAQAVRFALAAAGDGGQVTVIHSWWLEVVDGVVVTTPESEQWRVAVHRHESALQASLGDTAADYPAVEVRTSVVRGNASEVLLGAAAEADLLVVGSRGRGGFTGLLLGSVSQRVMSLAQCPVAVIHPDR